MRKERSDQILEGLEDQVKVPGTLLFRHEGFNEEFEQANCLSLPEHLKPGPPTTTWYSCWSIKNVLDINGHYKQMAHTAGPSPWPASTFMVLRSWRSSCTFGFCRLVSHPTHPVIWPLFLLCHELWGTMLLCNRAPLCSCRMLYSLRCQSLFQVLRREEEGERFR